MDSQQIAALVIVALAALFLGAQIWRQVKNKSGTCGGCGQCGRPSRPDIRAAPQAKPLVSLSALPPRRPTRKPDAN